MNVNLSTHLYLSYFNGWLWLMPLVKYLFDLFIYIIIYKYKSMHCSAHLIFFLFHSLLNVSIINLDLLKLSLLQTACNQYLVFKVSSRLYLATFYA